jgi:hypothetical protein
MTSLGFFKILGMAVNLYIYIYIFVIEMHECVSYCTPNVETNHGRRPSFISLDYEC